MIDVQDLCMAYGSFRALDKVSFQVKPGEVVGLLGPNGAGKSTTMKILTTYLFPKSGKATINGIDVTRDPLKIRDEIGYLPEVLPVYLDMEVIEYLEFVAQARGLRGSNKQQRIKWVAEKTGLKPMYRKLCRELSKGYRQRVGLAQALIHDPKVVILDEPTSGLDPIQIQEIRQLIRELGKEKTVILSTHILQEAEAVSDRIVIINKGKIVGDGTMGELQSKAHPYQKVLVSARVPSEELIGNLRNLRGCVEVLQRKSNNGSLDDRVGHCEIMTSSPEDIMARIGDLALERSWKLDLLKDSPYSLEETFVALTEKGTRI